MLNWRNDNKYDLNCFESNTTLKSIPANSPRDKLNNANEKEAWREIQGPTEMAHYHETVSIDGRQVNIYRAINCVSGIIWIIEPNVFYFQSIGIQKHNCAPICYLINTILQ